MNPIRIIVVDDVRETRENVQRLLSFERDIQVIGFAANGEEAVQAVEQHRPDIVLMDINMPVMDGIQATEQISLRYPETSVIILSVQGEQEYLKKAMMAGCREYLIKPFSADELAETVRRVNQLDQRKRQLNKVVPGTVEVKRTEGKVITLFSPKGGTGKSTVAANLAIALQQETRKGVVLVDLSLQAGDLGVFLNLVPRQTMAELVQESPEPDLEMVEGALVSHSSGIRLLAAPARPEYAELISGAQVERILKLLRKKYDYVIVDTASAFSETVLAAFDGSDQIMMLMTMDLPTIRNIKVALEVLDTLHQRGKTKLIVNRLGGDFDLTLEEVETSLNFFSAVQLVNESKVVLPSVNRGQPFILTQPMSRVGQGIRELAQVVIHDRGSQKELAAMHKKGLFKKLFG